MIIDSEFRDLLPPLSETERATLEENLKRDGCLTPLIVWGETLLDGHNRYEICERLEIPYEIQKIHLESRIEALQWIVANQDGRRNLGTFARSQIVLKCTQLIDALKAEAQSRIKDPRLMLDEGRHTGRTDETLAKLAHVGKDTLRKAQAVLERAPLEIITLAQTGEISTHRAYEITKALDTASERVKIITATHKLTEPETVKILANLHENSETLQDVLTNGYIDADGEQIHITESPLKIRDAIAKRAQAHKQIARESRDYRVNPNRRDLILYNTNNIAQTANALTAHYGDAIGLLIAELTKINPSPQEDYVV